MATKRAGQTMAAKMINLHLHLNGTSQKAMAEEMGIERRVLARFIRGQSIGGEDTLRVMEWLFRAPPDGDGES